MATNPFTGQSQSTTPKNRFWSKFRSAPKPTPRRKRGTSDSVLAMPPSLSLPSHTHPPQRKTTSPSLSFPSHTHPPQRKATPTQRSDDVFPSYSFLTKEVTLPEFAQRFQNNLPQQVVVTHGVYWRENLEVNISSSERLNIHFIRHRESVKVKELGGGTEYSIPVTSTIEFGPVYNPYNDNIKDALRGFVYPTIDDVIKITENAPLPKLISATSDSSSTAPGDHVSKGELLLIKAVRSNKEGHRELQVSSLTTKTDKFLHENCRGNFTTKPEAIKLSLFSIIKHIPSALPMSVMIFPGANLDQGDMHYPSHLFEKVIQLSRTFTDVLLVASSVPDGSVCDGREPFEIPQEIELELRVVDLGDGDREQLKEKSQQIMRKMQGDYIKQYRNAHQAQAEYVVQEMFLKAVGVSEETKKNPVPHPRRKKSESAERSDYPNVSPVHEGILARLGKLEETVWKMKKSKFSASGGDAEEKKTEKEEESAGKETTASLIQGLEEKIKEREGQVEATVSELRSLVELQQKQTQEELQRMGVELVALRGEVEEGRREVGQLQEIPVGPQQMASLYQQELMGSPETTQRNRDIVSSLSAAQVLQLLAEVGMEDLQLVSHENLTGDILIELNEEELETELGIKKRIQRLKVMKVINGSKAVTEYLKIAEPNSMDLVC